MKKLILSSLLIWLCGLVVIFLLYLILRLNPSTAYRIAYVSFDANAVTIHVMNPDGQRQRDVTRREDMVFKNAPSWAPSANEVVYIHSNSQDFRAKLLSVYIFGNEEPVFLGDSILDGTEPEWAPDGKQIVYAVRHPTRQYLQILTVKTGLRHNLTPPSDNVFHYNPCWSPDSQKVAFVEFRTGQQAIHVANRDGSDHVNLSDAANYHGTNLRELQWSPDGNWIAFVGIEENSATYNIYLLRPDGTGYNQLTSLDGQPINLRWSPDSQWLIFTVVFGADGVYRMRVADGKLESLPLSANPNQPITWSPDGKWIYYSRLDDNLIPNLFRSHPDGTGEQQLTHSPLPEFGPEPSPMVDRDWHLWIHGLIIGVGFVTLGRGVYARSRLPGRTRPQSRQ
jgi:Tol biopolymer transport system component